MKDPGKRKQKEVDLILNRSRHRMKTKRKRKISKKGEINQEKKRKANNQNPSKT